MRLAEGPALYRARWSEEIIAEVKRTLEGKFKIPSDRIAHRGNQSVGLSNGERPKGPTTSRRRPCQGPHSWRVTATDPEVLRPGAPAFVELVCRGTGVKI